MSHWSSWEKLVLVFVVCVAHVGLLAGFSFSFTSGKPSKLNKQAAANLSVTLIQAVSPPLFDGLAKPEVTTQKADNKPAEAVGLAKNQKVVLPEPPYQLGLQSSDHFLDANAVDKTAEPAENFGTQLSQMLPLNIQTLVLEFWIEKDGRTIEVRCVEGACTDAVVASLLKLADLEFAPAEKNNAAVASRKVIQIDPQPGFSF